MFAILLSLASFGVSVLFPVFASFKALESNDVALLKPWLTYWITFAIFSAVEKCFGFILSIVPFYGFFKLYFQIWLVLPQTKGSVFIYNNHISKFLHRYEKEIETFVNNFHDDFWVLLANLKNYLIEVVKTKVFGVESKTTKTESPFNYLTTFFTSSATEKPADNEIDLMSNSYVDSLLNQFKEHSDKSIDNTSISFLKSFLSTIPKGGLALKGEFDKVTGAAAAPATPVTKSGVTKSSPSTEISEKATKATEEVSEKVEDDIELVDADPNGSYGFGWIKVNKEKLD